MKFKPSSKAQPSLKAQPSSKTQPSLKTQPPLKRPRLLKNSSSLQSRLIILLKVLLACGLIYWLVTGGYFDLKALSHILFNPYYALLFIGLIGLNLVLVNLRWWVLLRSQGFQSRIPEVFSLGLVGIFFNHAVPGSIGGDLVKGYYLVQKYPHRKLQAGFTIVVDRALGLYTMSCLALLALATSTSFIKNNTMLMATALGVLSLFSLFTAFVFLSYSKRFKKKLFRLFQKLPGRIIVLDLYKALYSYRKNKKALLYATGLSILAQITMTVCFFCVGYILGESLEVMTYVFAVSVGLIIVAVPIAPAGIGVGQVAMLFLFQAHSGVSSQVGPVGLSIIQLTFLLWGLVGAYIYLKPKTQVQEVIGNI